MEPNPYIKEYSERLGIPSNLEYVDPEVPELGFRLRHPNRLGRISLPDVLVENGAEPDCVHWDDDL